jgi:hypothetical protein
MLVPLNPGAQPLSEARTQNLKYALVVMENKSVNAIMMIIIAISVKVIVLIN